MAPGADMKEVRMQPPRESSGVVRGATVNTDKMKYHSDVFCCIPKFQSRGLSWVWVFPALRAKFMEIIRKPMSDDKLFISEQSCSCQDGEKRR